ncbi:hypothetical protein DFJ73DRAFT_921762 [Zopfochytrium polystomum]|nr:hypothetical protein DFJ73DRAFT_921762 [Zopfochytrium polystomum]
MPKPFKNPVPLRGAPVKPQPAAPNTRSSPPPSKPAPPPPATAAPPVVENLPPPKAGWAGTTRVGGVKRVPGTASFAASSAAAATAQARRTWFLLSCLGWLIFSSPASATAATSTLAASFLAYWTYLDLDPLLRFFDVDPLTGEFLSATTNDDDDRDGAAVAGRARQVRPAAWVLVALAERRAVRAETLRETAAKRREAEREREAARRYETTVYQVNKALLPTALLDQSKVSQGGGDELFGRSAELKSILQEVKSWENAPQRKLVLLTGRSGLGKSALLNRLRSEIKQSDSVILCECAGDEVKQRMSFGALIQIFRCIALKLRAAGVSAQDFRSDQSKSSSLSDSHLASRYALYSNASLSDLPDIKDPDWVYLARVLEALGISRATSRLLAIIPGMKAFHVQDRLSGGDLTERVTVIIHRILEYDPGAEHLKLKVLTRRKWFDAESHKVLKSVLKSSQSTLFALGARTREEWEDSGQYDDYRSASTCWIELHPLSALALSEFVHAQLGHDIPQSLMVDIQAKTNGVPIAVLVALRSMKLGNREDASSSISHLVMDREKAISAQMDTLPKSLQTILAVASIIGQTFDLETVAGAVRNLDYSCEVGQTSSDVETEIRNGDRFGLLVCKSTDGKEYAFCHYLVQQGVQGSLLPKRRYLIHRAVIRTLEEQLLNGGDDSILLPIIIGHAMSLDDELPLKSSYLHRGFLCAGEDFKVEEAFFYFRSLAAMNHGFVDELSLADRLNHFRILSSLHYEAG